MNLNVLEYARKAVESGRAKIESDPYPHLVVDDVLPADVYSALEPIFPSVEYVMDGKPVEDNRTYLRNSISTLADPDLAPIWRDFHETNTQRSVFEQACAMFGDEIARIHPQLEENFGKPLEAFTTARRQGPGDSEGNRKADLMIDCQFGVNSPVVEVGTPRGPHVDRGAKLFSALLYFRDEKDESGGGEYELFKLRRGPFPRNKMKSVPHRYVETVKKVPYRSNRLVMWMNTPDAVHAVAPRTKTAYPRRYIAISGECFGGAMPSSFFSHFSQWDEPLAQLRATVGLL